MRLLSAKPRFLSSANSGLPWTMTGLVILELLLALACALLPVEPLLRGWLLVFGIASGLPVGSTVLLMVHALTGGEWGYAAAPALRPAAALTPLLLIAFLPLLIGLHAIYPWAIDASSIPADVARWYLNGAWFAIRALIALVGWSVLGVMFAGGFGSALLAGLGLAFFGLTISLVAVDWYLSIDPHYQATAFASMIAIQQMLSALAFAACLNTSPANGRTRADIGGLLIAMLLGVVYLEIMTYVIAWYGDLPSKAQWFLARGSTAWICALAAMSGASALAFILLCFKRVRSSPVGLRGAGSLILAAVTLHVTWIIVPSFDDQGEIIAAAFVIVAIAAGLLALGRFALHRGGASHVG